MSRNDPESPWLRGRFFQFITEADGESPGCFSQYILAVIEIDNGQVDAVTLSQIRFTCPLDSHTTDSEG